MRNGVITDALSRILFFGCHDMIKETLLFDTCMQFSKLADLTYDTVLLNMIPMREARDILALRQEVRAHYRTCNHAVCPALHTAEYYKFERKCKECLRKTEAFDIQFSASLPDGVTLRYGQETVQISHLEFRLPAHPGPNFQEFDSD